MSYDHIMLPIDVEHADRMGKAIEIALALAVQFGANLTFVGVTSELPGTSVPRLFPGSAVPDPLADRPPDPAAEGRASAPSDK